MLASLARGAILAILLHFLYPAAPAFADDLADFNAAVEKASAHNRVAIGYLRTGNLELAELEIERLREAWGQLSARFAGKRPAVFEGNERYGALWVTEDMRQVGINLMMNMGKPDAVAKALTGLRTDLYELRKSGGVVVLADCVRDANDIMDAFMVYNDRALDFAKPETRADVAGKAKIYGAALERCDGIAGETRTSPEFRRLVDGAKASLEFIPKAIETRDAGLLRRVLIELRSFDNLLAFRYG